MAYAPAVSVVLPVRNQADHIVAVVDSYVAGLSQLHQEFEIILVENESEDGSLLLCRELARRHPSVSVIHNDRRGFGRAVCAGLAVAKGDTLCYTNCAYTPSTRLVDALDLFRENMQDPGSLVVHTVRERRASFMRRTGSFLFNVECRLLFGLETKDVNGTPKVFHRTLWNQLSLAETGSLFDVEFVIRSRMNGARFVELPVVFSPRFGGTSATTPALAFKLYTGAFLLWLRKLV